MFLESHEQVKSYRQVRVAGDLQQQNGNQVDRAASDRFSMQRSCASKVLVLADCQRGVGVLAACSSSHLRDEVLGAAAGAAGYATATPARRIDRSKQGKSLGIACAVLQLLWVSTAVDLLLRPSSLALQVTCPEHPACPPGRC